MVSPLRRIFEEAFNQGNLAIVDEVLSVGYKANIAFNGAPNSRQGFKWVIAMYRSAFPDLQCTVEDEISVGDMVAAHWIMRGTHKGMYLGNQPTDRPVEIQGLTFARVENGCIVEDWMLIDEMGILQQLGVIPPAIHKER